MIPRGGRSGILRKWGAGILGGLAIAGLLPGCITSEVITVTELSLSGQIPLPPVRVTVDSIAPGVVFSPRVTRFPAGEMTGTVGAKTYYAPASNRLVWKVPLTEYGFDMDINLTDNFALSGGFTIAQGDGETHLNGRFGLGLFGASRGLGARLDGGLISSSLDYAGRTTVKTRVEYWIGGSDNYTTYFADRGSTSLPGAYVQLTLNSVIPRFPVNFFVSGGVTWRNLGGFTPVMFDTAMVPNDRIPAEGEVSEPAAIFNVSPGLSVNLWGSSRLLVGARMIMSDIDNQMPWPAWLPFLQIDLAL